MKDLRKEIMHSLGWDGFHVYPENKPPRVMWDDEHIDHLKLSFFPPRTIIVVENIFYEENTKSK